MSNERTTNEQCSHADRDSVIRCFAGLHEDSDTQSRCPQCEVRPGIVLLRSCAAPHRGPAHAQRTGMRNDTNSNMPLHPTVHVCLSECDGNVYAILGTIRRAVMRSALPDRREVWEVFRAEANRGDYNHVLATAFRWFEID